MNTALAFGTFVPGKSPVHKLNAQVKIILACAFSIGAFFVESWIGMALLWAVVIAGYAMSKIRIGNALAGLKPVAFILVFTVIAHLFSWEHGATVEGLVEGLFFALRIALLVVACCLLTFSTSSQDMMRGLKSLMRPLEVLKVPTDDLCMVASIALRFVPTITEEANAARSAREARGSRFEGGGVLASIKAWVGVIAPLFVSLFKRADRLARAMDARCYTGQGRSSLKAGRMGAADVLVCLVGLMLVVAVGALL